MHDGGAYTLADVSYNKHIQSGDNRGTLPLHTLRPFPDCLPAVWSAASDWPPTPTGHHTSGSHLGNNPRWRWRGAPARYQGYRLVVSAGRCHIRLARPPPLTSPDSPPTLTSRRRKQRASPRYVLGFSFAVEILLFPKPTRCMLTSFNFCCDFRDYILGIPPKSVSELFP